MLVLWYMSVDDKEKIVALLERLEELRKRGLINEAEYEEKRNQLLSIYLELKPENKRQIHKERKALLITSIIIGAIIIGLVATYSLKFVQLPNNTTTVTVTPALAYPNITPATQTTTVTVIQEQKFTPTVIYPNTSLVITWKGDNERIVYDGSPYLERVCRVYEIVQINAKKDDLIRVVWDSDDDDTYVAIGTDADLQRVKGYYCEVLVSFWQWNWPAASYGYSGTLEFKVPSSATWKILVLNGNWGCVMSNCPITVTKLRIIYIEK